MIHLLQKMLAGLFFATVAYAQTNGIAIAPMETTEAQMRAILSYVPKDDEKDVYSLVWYYARQYDVDLALTMRIADCESSWKIDAKNKNSTASGPFQMLDGTFKYVQGKMGKPIKRGVLKDEVEAAIYLMAKEGTKHWQSSAKCWLHE